MLQYQWSDFVTDTLVDAVQNGSSLQFNQEIRTDVANLIEQVFSSIGGACVFESSLSDSDLEKYGEFLLREAIGHMLGRNQSTVKERSYFKIQESADFFNEKIVGSPIIRINEVQTEALEQLPVIGKVLAQRMIDERRANGPFRRWDDLKMRVNGIGSFAERTLHHVVTFSIDDESGKLWAGEDSVENGIREVLKVIPGDSSPEHLLSCLDLMLARCFEDQHLRHRYMEELPPVEFVANATNFTMINADAIGVIRNAGYLESVRNLIINAQQKIDICMFHVATGENKEHPSHQLIDAIRANSVTSRVLLDKDRDSDPYKSTIINTPAKLAFEEAGATVRFDSTEKLLHSKFIVIDNEVVIIGSHNWTNFSYFINDEVSLIVKSTEFGQQMAQRFQKLWDQAGDNN